MSRQYPAVQQECPEEIYEVRQPPPASFDPRSLPEVHYRPQENRPEAFNTPLFHDYNGAIHYSR